MSHRYMTIDTPFDWQTLPMYQMVQWPDKDRKDFVLVDVYIQKGSLLHCIEIYFQITGIKSSF